MAPLQLRGHIKIVKKARINNLNGWLIDRHSTGDKACSCWTLQSPSAPTSSAGRRDYRQYRSSMVIRRESFQVRGILAIQDTAKGGESPEILKKH